MAVNLKAIKPHKVSRDLSGYITYVYGEAKSGKSTLGSQLPKPLFLAAEKGYNALPGVMAQDITSWGDIKATLRQLKDPEVQEMFKSIVVDTIDLTGAMCEKYVCQQNGVEKLADIPYGGGWNLVKREFEDTWRAITQMGYALLFISHAKDRTFKRKDGTEYNQVVPSCPSTYNEIAKNMADLYMFAEKYSEGENARVRLVIRSLDNSVDTGSRFKYIQPVLPEFNYQSLVKALNEAIEKEEKMIGNSNLFTDERNVEVIQQTYDYEGLMAQFGQLVQKLMGVNETYFGPRITVIVDKYLGKGRKVSEATIDQAELISLINTEIEEELVPAINQFTQS